MIRFIIMEMATPTKEVWIYSYCLSPNIIIKLDFLARIKWIDKVCDYYNKLFYVRLQEEEEDGSESNEFEDLDRSHLSQLSAELSCGVDVSLNECLFMSKIFIKSVMSIVIVGRFLFATHWLAVRLSGRINCLINNRQRTE